MMNKKEFLHLKSGTDVRGTAVETAEHGVQLTDESKSGFALRASRINCIPK